MKKVLRMCTYPTEEFSGMGLNSYMLSGMNNVNTIYLAPYYSKNTFKINENTKLILKKFITKPKPAKLLLLKVLHEIQRIAYIFYFSSYGIKLIHQYNVDIVHIHSPMFFITAFYGKIMGCTCYITYHGNEFKTIYRYTFLRKLFSAIFKISFSLSTEILASFNDTNNYKQRIRIINNAVDRTIYINRRLTRKKQIITVGRLEKQKGYNYLLQGFKKFRKSNSEYKLVIIGSGQLLEELRAVCKQGNLESDVDIYGQIKRKELIDLYNHSEVFILSSLWEGFPKVLLEAMSCGCKIIATRVDAVPSIIGENYNFLIDAKNSNEIANALKTVILKDYKYFWNIYDQRLNKYSWNKIKYDMERIYIQD